MIYVFIWVFVDRNHILVYTVWSKPQKGFWLKPLFAFGCTGWNLICDDRNVSPIMQLQFLQLFTFKSQYYTCYRWCMKVKYLHSVWFSWERTALHRSGRGRLSWPRQDQHFFVGGKQTSASRCALWTWPWLGHCPSDSYWQTLLGCDIITISVLVCWGVRRQLTGWFFFFLIAILLCVSHYQSHQLKQVVFLKLLIFLGSFLYVPNLALFVNLASALWEFQPSFPSLFPGLGETCFQKEALEILCMEIGTTL